MFASSVTASVTDAACLRTAIADNCYTRGLRLRDGRVSCSASLVTAVPVCSVTGSFSTRFPASERASALSANHRMDLSVLRVASISRGIFSDRSLQAGLLLHSAGEAFAPRRNDTSGFPLPKRKNPLARTMRVVFNWRGREGEGEAEKTHDGT